MEDPRQVRRAAVERLNGRLATWWHYNRMTLVVLLSAICTLVWILHDERVQRQDTDALHVAIAKRFAQLQCYSSERPTAILIAGGSRKMVDDALLSAAATADELRSLLKASRDHPGN